MFGIGVHIVPAVPNVKVDGYKASRIHPVHAVVMIVLELVVIRDEELDALDELKELEYVVVLWVGDPVVDDLVVDAVLRVVDAELEPRELLDDAVLCDGVEEDEDWLSEWLSDVDIELELREVLVKAEDELLPAVLDEELTAVEEVNVDDEEVYVIEGIDIDVEELVGDATRAVALRLLYA